MPSALDDFSVYVVCPTTRDFSVQTMLSFLNTQEAALKAGLKIDFAFIVGSLPHHARTLGANKYLATEYSRLFFIDSDMVWEPEEFFSVLLNTRTRDCVVGLYPRKMEQAGYFARIRPEAQVSDGGLLPIEGTGLGFACIQRRVIEELAAHAPMRLITTERMPSLFRMDEVDGEERGEDYAFWADVLKHGFKIWADVTVTVGHIGPKIYRTTVKEKLANDSPQKPPVQ